ncbi:Bacteriophage-related protein [Azospirillaceae bacterium]
MTRNIDLSSDGSILSIQIPIKFKKRGGRKMIVAPPDAPLPLKTTWAPPSTKTDPTLIKAVARAFRWKKLLDTGQYATIKELAEAEDVDRSYVGEILQLTLLAPDIIEMILDGRLPKGVTLAHFREPWPGEWGEQREKIRRLAEGADMENAYNK